MYVGHFAVGMAIKAAKPELPSLPILLGVGFMDVVYGVFTALGIDRVTPNLKSGPYLFFDLTFIDWDHSLLMAVVLSLLWATFFYKDRRVALAAGIASFSHFLADWPMHNNDLALYPHAQAHLGFGLWGKLGTGSWALEGVFAAVLIAYAWRESKERGVNLLWPTVLLALMFVNLSPWLSPMKFVAALDEPAAHLANGALVTIGFLVPGLLLTCLVNSAERKVAVVPRARANS